MSPHAVHSQVGGRLRSIGYRLPVALCGIGCVGGLLLAVGADPKAASVRWLLGLSGLLALTIVPTARIASARAAALDRSRAAQPLAFAQLATALLGALVLIPLLLPQDVRRSLPWLDLIRVGVFDPVLLAALLLFSLSFVRGHLSAVWIDTTALLAALLALTLQLAGPALRRDPAFVRATEMLLISGDVLISGLCASLACLMRSFRPQRMLVLVSMLCLTAGDALRIVDAPGRGVQAVATVVGPVALLLLAVGVRQPPRIVVDRRGGAGLVLVPVSAALVATALAFSHHRSNVTNVLAMVALLLVLGRLAWHVIENVRLIGILQRVSSTDSLTGLANRALATERIRDAITRLSGSQGVLALMLLDLDDFKYVNDTMGHFGGDEVLCEVALRLSRLLEREDAETSRPESSPSGGSTTGRTVARLGGDEFVVLLEATDEGHALGVGQSLLGAIAQPLAIGDRRIDLRGSLGIALARAGDSPSPESLLRKADTAMYAAKEEGKGKLCVFEPAMQSRIDERVELTRRLRSAIADGELRLLYQPQVDLVTRRMTGVEALVRWQHPELGLLTPDRFIPHAEATGAIVEIDDWVLGQACRQLREWHLSGLPITMAVNVSGARVNASGLIETLEYNLRASGVDPDALELEITETLAITEDDRCVATLRRVRELGIHTAIDDFGVGHSALSRLQSFPVDRVKIDRSFTNTLQPRAAGSGSLVGAICAMASTLGIRVIAEGVETVAQVAALREFGCLDAQGFLFSRPVDPEEIPQLAGRPLSPAVEVARQDAQSEPLLHGILMELERLTGLESTYISAIDLEHGSQRVVRVRNTGRLEIPEDLEVDWQDTLCKRSFDRKVPFTCQIARDLGVSEAAESLGLLTYAGVPIHNANGRLIGSLCGASQQRLALPEATQKLMEGFAALIGRLRFDPSR